MDIEICSMSECYSTFYKYVFTTKYISILSVILYARLQAKSDQPFSGENVTDRTVLYKVEIILNEKRSTSMYLNTSYL